jgi:hypothetical protein
MTRGVSSVVLAALLVAASCGDTDQQPAAANSNQVATGDPLSRTTETGPVKATVEIVPAAPRLGDSITLTLTVEAEAEVEVEMPTGEAVGRFSIANFTPRSETTAGGGTRHTQRYTLLAPMSGLQRIPSLRIEFVDQRPGQAQGNDGGVVAHELLTEEISLEIASVDPEGTVTAKLRPIRGSLEPPRISALDRWLPGMAGVGVLIIAIILFLLLRGRSRGQARISAYDKAMTELAALEKRGLPGEEEADAWYVDLSGIVRRYLEDRYGLRAPELTTEEFLREAQRSHQLSEHRSLLSSFLESCDQVKFAGYRPGETESRDALSLARRFLEETRYVAAEPEAAARAPA